MTTTIPAAAAQIISSPIKPSSPNSEGVVGPRVFTDLEISLGLPQIDTLTSTK